MNVSLSFCKACYRSQKVQTWQEQDFSWRKKKKRFEKNITISSKTDILFITEPYKLLHAKPDDAYVFVFFPPKATVQQCKHYTVVKTNGWSSVSHLMEAQVILNGWRSVEDVTLRSDHQDKAIESLAGK